MPQQTNHDTRWIFLGALVVRLAFCAAYPLIAASFGGGDGYDLIAQSLLRGEGYRIDAATAAVERLPLYPLILASSGYLFGPSAWPWQVLQSIAGAALCVIVYRLGVKIGSRRGAVCAAAFCAVHPTLVLYAARPFTEVLFGLLLILQIEALSSGATLGGGFAWGGQLLMKSIAWSNAVLLWPLARRDGARAPLRVLVGVVICLVPWLAYQWSTGETVRLATMGGRTLYQGLFISQHVGWATPAGDLVDNAEVALRDDLQRAGVAADADTAVIVKLAGDRAWTWIAGHPAESLRLFARNLVLTWYLGRSRASMAIHALLHAALLIGAALGARRAWQSGENRFVVTACASVIIAYTMIHAAIHPGVRYILPAVPLAAVLAAAALQAAPKKPGLGKSLNFPET